MSLCVVNNTHAMDSIHSKSNSISNCLDEFKNEVRAAISVIEEFSKNNETIDYGLLSSKLTNNKNGYKDIIMDLLGNSNKNKTKLIGRLEDIITYCDEISKNISCMLTINIVNWFNKSNKKYYGLLSQNSNDIIKVCLPQNKSTNKIREKAQVIKQDRKEVDAVKKIHNILDEKIKDIALKIDNYDNKKSLNEIIMKFKNLVYNYNLVTFDSNITNDIHSGTEQFFHKLYLDYLSSEYMSYSRNNCAYATISMNCDNNDNESNSTIMISSTEYYKKSTDVFKNTYTNGEIEISNYEKYTNKYDSNTLISFDDFNGQYNDSITDLCKKYLLVDGRGVVKDDEFQILYYLFRNANEIAKTLLNNSKNETKNITLDIKLFTYMDMCPSCWTAWNKCYKGLKTKYNDCILSNLNKNVKLDKLNFNLNINVYSIKPYIISKEHPFVTKDIVVKNADANKLNINDVNNWCEPKLRNELRQSNVKFKEVIHQTEDCPVRQIVDSEGLNMMKKYRNNREQFTKYKMKKDASCVVC